MSERLELVQRMYAAFSAGDRDTIERALSDELTFSSPVDPQLDRAGYFERCWPHAGGGQRFELVREVETRDEVIVTYEVTWGDGARGRNTEVLTFDGDRIRRVEVYFGWSL